MPRTAGSVAAVDAQLVAVLSEENGFRTCDRHLRDLSRQTARHGWRLSTRLGTREEPERLSEAGKGGFTGAPDMSHEPRPEERRGER